MTTTLVRKLLAYNYLSLSIYIYTRIFFTFYSDSMLISLLFV